MSFVGVLDHDVPVVRIACWSRLVTYLLKLVELFLVPAVHKSRTEEESSQESGYRAFARIPKNNYWKSRGRCLTKKD